MLKYYTIPPAETLKKYLRCFWALEHSEGYIYRSIADGCTEMVFHYNGVFDEIMPNGTVEKSFVSGIHGQSRHSRRFIAKSGFKIFGVYLYPYALRQLFSIAADTLSDEMPDLITLLGAEGRQLEEQIMLASNNRERVRVMTCFFERKIRAVKNDSASIVYVINKLVHTQGIASIDKLANDCYLSRRQFERQFKTHAGFSPQLYKRILRFQAATQEYYNNPKSLTDIAYSCGYYDQSHFIHEFKTFSGFHPKEYFYGAPEGGDYRDVTEKH